jgi:prepilin-type N-terminal cleavage/methylation domain-containing protein/prepilin-type processing-associated H-X9-DG protein
MKEPRQLAYGPSSNAAFSLIELLVVVAILAIITALFWSYGPSRRDRELDSCRQNLERIYLAMDIYSRDNNSKYPVVTNAATSEAALAPLVPHYTSDTQIFVCPASGNPFQPVDTAFSNWKISYAYYMGHRSSDPDAVVMSDEQINTHDKSKGDTVFSETGKPPGNNHGKGGGNFMLCDGSVVPSDVNAPFSLRFTQPIVLLNP